VPAKAISLFKIISNFTNHAFAGTHVVKVTGKPHTAPLQPTLSRRDLQRIVAEMVG